MVPVIVLNNEQEIKPELIKERPTSNSKNQFRYKVKDVDLMNFTKNIQTQITSGVSILRALETQTIETNTILSKVAKELIHSLTGGNSLSESLESFPNIFSPLYKNLVKAGEHSGKLDKILEEIANYLEWKIKMKKIIKKAVSYPIFIFTLTFFSLLFILGFVFPKLSVLFEKIGNELPAHARFLIKSGEFVSQYWWFILTAYFVVFLLAYLTFRYGWGKNIFFKILENLPIMGNAVRSLELSRFLKTLSILEASGIPFVKALGLTRGVLDNPKLVNAIEEIEKKILQGSNFSEALESTNIMPPMVLNLISVGEESGKMTDSLKRLAMHFDEDAKEKIAKALTILEPAMILFIGIFVALITGSVISTLYKAVILAGR